MWLGGSKFTWEFPQHLQLFVELQDLEIRGYAMTASRLEGSKGGGKMHCLKIAKSQTDRFEQYVNRGDPWMDDALLVAAARAKDGGAMGAGGAVLGVGCLPLEMVCTGGRRDHQPPANGPNGLQ